MKAMPPSPTHIAQDRAVHIPGHIQQEMTQQLQQTMPAHLQYYQKSGGYVPPHVQQEIAQHMQQTMPAHLKQYINPYMQQEVMTQQLHPRAPVAQTSYSPPESTHMITPNPAQEPEPPHYTGPVTAPKQSTFSEPPKVNAQADTETNTPYNFITDQAKPARQPLFAFFSGASFQKQLAILGGGFMACLILILLLRGLFSTGFNLPPFIAVLQDQQELLHIMADISQTPQEQAALPSTFQNFMATAQATITSSQSQLLIYLANNKQVVSPVLMNAKESLATDNALKTASFGNVFGTEFYTIMSKELLVYHNDIRFAYAHTAGPKGHIQLQAEYSQIPLLMKELTQANASI